MADERLNRARALLIAYPDWGRRKVNAQLKKEFGVGLRAATIGHIALELERPASMRAQLRVAGFLPWERKVLGDFVTHEQRPYIKQAISDRFLFFQQSQARGLTKRQYAYAIRKLYKEKGWLVLPTATKRRAGTPDPYALLRYYRNKSIESGEYIPPVKPKRKPYDKGDVRAQGARWRRKQKDLKTFRERLKDVGEVVYNPITKRYEVEYL